MLSNPRLEKSAYLGIARCRVAKGDRFEAIVILEEANRKLGEQPEFLSQLARQYDSTGNYSKSAEAITRLMKLQPSNTGLHNSLGDAYLKMGEYTKARQQYEKILVKEPENRHALKSISRLETLGH